MAWRAPFKSNLPATTVNSPDSRNPFRSSQPAGTVTWFFTHAMADCPLISPPTSLMTTSVNANNLQNCRIRHTKASFCLQSDHADS